MPNVQYILTEQKIFWDISNNFIDNNNNIGLLNNNNFAHGNIDMDIEAKPNLNKNMTGKNINNFCKNDFETNIENYLNGSKIGLLIKNC